MHGAVPRSCVLAAYLLAQGALPPRSLVGGRAGLDLRGVRRALVGAFRSPRAPPGGLRSRVASQLTQRRARDRVARSRRGRRRGASGLTVVDDGLSLRLPRSSGTRIALVHDARDRDVGQDAHAEPGGLAPRIAARLNSRWRVRARSGADGSEPPDSRPDAARGSSRGCDIHRGRDPTGVVLRGVHGRHLQSSDGAPRCEFRLARRDGTFSFWVFDFERWLKPTRFRHSRV